MNQSAAAGAAVTGSISAIPVVWDFLGYHFPAGPLIVGILAVIITRCIVYLNTKGRKQVILDLAVCALCMLLTALWIQANQLDLLKAGVTGIGIGSVGIGIVGIAKSAFAGRMRAALDAFIAPTPKA